MSALRHKLHALVDEFLDTLEQAGRDEWVDQYRSPLGKSKHLSLARRGVLPASKDGKQVLIRRSDIDAYLSKRAIVIVDEQATEEAEINRMVAELTRRSG
jgi:excisionase family DNA binding protein